MPSQFFGQISSNPPRPVDAAVRGMKAMQDIQQAEINKQLLQLQMVHDKRMLPLIEQRAQMQNQALLDTAALNAQLAGYKVEQAQGVAASATAKGRGDNAQADILEASKEDQINLNKQTVEAGLAALELEKNNLEYTMNTLGVTRQRALDAANTDQLNKELQFVAYAGDVFTNPNIEMNHKKAMQDALWQHDANGTLPDSFKSLLEFDFEADPSTMNGWAAKLGTDMVALMAKESPGALGAQVVSSLLGKGTDIGSRVNPNTGETERTQIGKSMDKAAAIMQSEVNAGGEGGEGGAFPDFTKMSKEQWEENYRVLPEEERKELGRSSSVGLHKMQRELWATINPTDISDKTKAVRQDSQVIVRLANMIGNASDPLLAARSWAAKATEAKANQGTKSFISAALSFDDLYLASDETMERINEVLINTGVIPDRHAPEEFVPFTEGMTGTAATRMSNSLSKSLFAEHRKKRYNQKIERENLSILKLSQNLENATKPRAVVQSFFKNQKNVSQPAAATILELLVKYNVPIPFYGYDPNKKRFLPVPDKRRKK